MPEAEGHHHHMKVQGGNSLCLEWVNQLSNVSLSTVWCTILILFFTSQQFTARPLHKQLSDACTHILIRSLTALLCTTQNMAPTDVLYKVDAVY